MQKNITIPSLKGRGWQESEGRIIPVWLEGNQFPRSLSRLKNNINSKKRNSGNSEDSLRKRRNHLRQEITKCKESTASRWHEYSPSSFSEIISSGWEVWKAEDVESTNSSDNDRDW